MDFSPVDRGTVLHRILVTVHNCSAQPVELAEPFIWFGGREGMTDYLRLDAERTNLTALTLPAWESAQAVFSWEADAATCPDAGGATGECVVSDVLSVRFPGIGEGELHDNLDLTPTTRAWLSGWTR